MLQEQMAPSYCDKDALFDEPRNSDYSHRHGGVLKERFTSVFQPFVQVCVEREGLEVSWGGGGGGGGGEGGREGGWVGGGGGGEGGGEGGREGGWVGGGWVGGREGGKEGLG